MLLEKLETRIFGIDREEHVIPSPNEVCVKMFKEKQTIISRKTLYFHKIILLVVIIAAMKTIG